MAVRVPFMAVRFIYGGFDEPHGAKATVLSNDAG